MRVAILAPIGNSLYARCVTHLLKQTPGIDVVGVLVRTPWTWQRVRSEFRRDGARLLRKAYRKLVLRQRDFDQTSSQNLLALARECQLPGNSLRDLCQLHRIAYRVANDPNDAAALTFLQSLAADAMAFTGGGLIRQPLLQMPRHGVINCHMGILPRYRGMDVVEYPLVEERLADEGIGLTLHVMDQGLDTGPILLQEPLKLLPGETFRTLRQRMERLMAELMVRGIVGLQQGDITPQPQRVEAGRQYFVMHPRLEALAEAKLLRITTA